MRKRGYLMIILCLALVAVLGLSLVGCLKIGMRERNIQKRLEDAGAEISHERTAPMLYDGTSAQLNGIGTILFSYMGVTERDSDTNEDVEHQEILYIIFAKTDESGDWAEAAAKSWLETQKQLRADGQEDPNGDVQAEWDLDKWNVYRYENIVMCGHYQILAVARSY